MARHKRDIDWNLVERFMEAGCSAKQICKSMELKHSNFYERFNEEFGYPFSEYLESSAQYGEALILLNQYMKSLNNDAPGNAQMLIWLGKVRLAQREPEPVQTQAANQPQIDQSHKIMELQHEISELREKLVNQSKAE